MIHSPMIHEHYAIVGARRHRRAMTKAHAEFVRASEEYHAAWIALVRESYAKGEMASANAED